MFSGFKHALTAPGRVMIGGAKKVVGGMPGGRGLNKVAAKLPGARHLGIGQPVNRKMTGSARKTSR